MSDRPTYVVHLRAEGSDTDAIRALRGFLKLARRRFRLRAVSIHEEPTRPSSRRGRARSATPAVEVMAMGLGKRKGQEFLPRLKYDARSGALYLETRINNGGVWESQQRSVTEGFRAIFDLETVEIGWMHFPKGAAPNLVLVPVGQDAGDAPTPDHKQGFRLLVKMPSELGGDVREFISTALATWNAIDALHTPYAKEAGKHPSQLPIVKLTETIEIRAANGTSFTPVFEIDGWVARPADLPTGQGGTTNGGTQRKPAQPTRRGRDDFDSEIPF
jgi:hypothetical protein